MLLFGVATTHFPFCAASDVPIACARPLASLPTFRCSCFAVMNRHPNIPSSSAFGPARPRMSLFDLRMDWLDSQCFWLFYFVVTKHDRLALHCPTTPVVKQATSHYTHRSRGPSASTRQPWPARRAYIGPPAINFDHAARFNPARRARCVLFSLVVAGVRVGQAGAMR
jgi:hypothetical protein